MSMFTQHVLDGMTNGAIYGSLALALVLIYRSTGIVNFSQGEMATIAAFIAWQLHDSGMPLLFSLCVAAVFSFTLGVVVFRLAIRPLIGAPAESMVVVTIGLLLLIQATTLWIWGADQRLFFQIFPGGSWSVFGVTLTRYSASIMMSIGVIALILSALFNLTKPGLAMRAAALEREKSALVGIRVETMLMLGWGLASIIGFAAAVLVAPKLFLSPTMMVPLLLYSLAAATLGGWDSPFGAVLGGVLVGVAESLGASYLGFIGAELRLTIPIGITLIILLFRPNGLFGRASVVRV